MANPSTINPFLVAKPSTLRNPTIDNSLERDTAEEVGESSFFAQIRESLAQEVAPIECMGGTGSFSFNPKPEGIVSEGVVSRIEIAQTIKVETDNTPSLDELIATHKATKEMTAPAEAMDAIKSKLAEIPGSFKPAAKNIGKETKTFFEACADLWNNHIVPKIKKPANEDPEKAKKAQEQKAQQQLARQASASLEQNQTGVRAQESIRTRMRLGIADLSLDQMGQILKTPAQMVRKSVDDISTMISIAREREAQAKKAAEENRRKAFAAMQNERATKKGGRSMNPNNNEGNSRTSSVGDAAA